jgi:lysozyme
MEMVVHLRFLSKALPLALLASAAACSDLPTGMDPSPFGETRGVDVSHWQGVVDWRAVESEGISFAFVKATEGATYTDPRFAANWSGLGATRITRGAYHYFRPGTDAAQQAAHFLRTVPVGRLDLPPVLDVETTDGVDGATLARGVRTWIDAVERATGKRPIVYTYPAFWNAHLSTAFIDAPLWIAHYRAGQPSVPAGWTGWAFWQQSDDGRVPGVSGPVDLDVFNGTEMDLQSFVSSQGRLFP